MLILEILVFFGTLIFIHELGHFLVAKAVGVRIEVFSLGFGPRLIGFRKGFTDYRISAVPFGGYVKMAGQFDIPDEEAMKELKGEPWEFPSKTWWQRFLIASAGSTMNIVLAVMVFFLVAFIWGIPIFESDIQVGLVDHTMAEYSVFKQGDRILNVNGKQLKSWNDFIRLLSKSPEKTVTCKLKRDDKTLTVNITPAAKTSTNGKITYGRIGITPFLKPEVGKVFEDQPASKGRLHLISGDIVKVVDGKKIEQWEEMRRIVSKKAKLPVTFTVLRKRPFPLKMLVKTKNKDLSKYGLVLDKFKTIQKVEPESLAFDAGFISGDVIKGISFSPVPLWKKLLYRILGKNVQRVMTVTTLRQKTFKTIITPSLNPIDGTGYIGISNKSAGFIREVGRKRPKLTDAMLLSLDSTIFYSQIIFITIKKLIVHEIPMDNLAGPVGITEMISKQAKSGFKELLEFLAILSLNLGIINFFPIPVLDGGMMVVLLVEGIRRKPLTLKFQIALQQIGLLLLIPLIIYVTINDIIRMLGNILTP